MTGATISQRHVTPGCQASRQPKGCARSSLSCSRRPSRAAEFKHPAPRGRADRHTERQSHARRSQYHLHGLRPGSRANHPGPVKSP